jgi:superoxide dismutase, Cu-Zn family
MTPLRTAITAGLLVVVPTLAQERNDSESPAMAAAVLTDSQGRAVGQVSLRQAPHGVVLKLELKNATPGIHGLHMHDVGKCDPPTFESAGGHFNPTRRAHGFLNPRGQHAGDLPNIAVPAAAEQTLEYFVTDVTIEPGPTSILDANGTSLVIHSGRDDYLSDPAGESGDRLACGPITRSDR